MVGEALHQQSALIKPLFIGVRAQFNFEQAVVEPVTSQFLLSHNRLSFGAQRHNNVSISVFHGVCGDWRDKLDILNVNVFVNVGFKELCYLLRGFQMVWIWR